MKPRGKAFSEDQVRALTTILARDNSKRGRRNLALFRTGIDTMLRVSDLCLLKIGDVAVCGDGVQIRNEITTGQKKAGKPVRTPISNVTAKALKRYIEDISDINPGTTLFPIHVRTVQRMIKRLAKKIDLDTDQFTPHSMRRTKAEIICSKMQK